MKQNHINALIDGIYNSIMSNDDFGLGEMGDARDEATRIVMEWIETCNIKVDYLHNASYYLSEFESTIEEQVKAIERHENQNDLIDNVEDVYPWEPLEGRFTCSEFLELIGHY